MGDRVAAHRHRWEDVTERGSPYVVERCNGFGGCGTIRRISRSAFRPGQGQIVAPPDAAWEIMFEGEDFG
jgi:hypothetical protein